MNYLYYLFLYKKIIFDLKLSINRKNVKMEYIESKSILSKLKQIDSFFGISYNMNLYRGCQHACVYCDTRSKCYQVGDISRIKVKRNAIELLKKELSAKRQKATIGTGSMNDPYMPLEKETGLTRKALEVIVERKFPVHIITKSDLVIRDIDLIKEISKTYAAVSITITSSNDELAKKIEPNASSSSARFKVLEVLAKNGIYTGMTLMPLLPFINDTTENIENILKRAKDSGVSYIIPMFGLTLRKGSREYLYSFFELEYPGMKEKYEKTFGENYICNSPDFKNLYDTFYHQIANSGINSKMDFYKPKNSGQLSLF